eukprot:TRINITY_DN11100_c0_g1_i1.p1 TRINITY_DN11100_c0_g1~~TRINITY_DN11100_c0_g1_i1.p1  ORF type:complete len:255 (-),score=118.61 TRINITY_DN11100_c0_g1_i1:69-800(-)
MNPVDLKKEEDRLLASITRKAQPKSAQELRKEREAKEAQTKREQERRTKQEDESRRLKEHKEAASKNALVKDEKADAREVEREREREESNYFEKHMDDKFDEDAACQKEAERFAKMMGIKTENLLGKGTPKSARRHDEPNVKPENAGLRKADEQGEKEAQRFAAGYGISPRKLDPKKIAEDEEKEAKRKDLENRIANMDSSDPRALSRAFLTDPELLGVLKEAKGIAAVNSLKGVEIPGGHKF